MKAMKKVGVKTVKKALEKAKPKRKALGKAKVKGKVSPKNSINKTNLEKLGRMSLDDKVKAAAESGDNLEEQAAVLKSSLEKDEHSQVWGRYQTYLKHNPEEKERVDTLSKKEKGQKAAEWLMETAGKQYMHVSKSVSATESWKRGNKWESEKQMLDKFDWEEFESHCYSGRIVYRADPHTPNVWQYKDTQDWSSDVTVRRGKKWEQGKEMEPNAEQNQSFSHLYDHESIGIGLEDIAGKGFGKGKSFGKGKGKGTKGKGKGKGFGKGQLAIMDKEEEEEESEEEKHKPTEEEELKDGLKKARKARDQVASAQCDLEEALGKASPKLSGKGKAAAHGWSASLSKVLQNLKTALAGKEKGLKAAKLKELLAEAAKAVKGAKDEAKELQQLANKEASVAGSKKVRQSLWKRAAFGKRQPLEKG